MRNSPRFSLKFRKIRTLSQLKDYLKHNLRSIEVVNAFADRSPLNRHLSGPQRADLFEWACQKLKGIKIKANSILAASCLLEVSPEYLRPGQAEIPGLYLEEKLEPWLEVSRDWAEKNFPQIINVTAHLDEVTPHIHLLFLPVGPEGRLNYARCVGTRACYSGFQESYAEAVRHLGLRKSPGNFLINAVVDKNRHYYHYIAQSLLAAPLQIPHNIPQLSKRRKLFSRIEFLDNDFGQRTLAVSLGRMADESDEKWVRVKRNLTACQEKHHLLIGQTQAFFEEIEAANGQERLIRDQSLKHWLSVCPWAKKDLRKTESSDPPVPPQQPDGRQLTHKESIRQYKRKRTQLSPPLKGTYYLGYLGPVSVDGSGWEFLVNGTKGKGGLTFLTNFLGYPEGEEDQARLILSANPALARKYGDWAEWPAQAEAVLALKYLDLCLNLILKDDPCLDDKMLTALRPQKFDNPELRRFLDTGRWPTENIIGGNFLQESQKEPLLRGLLALNPKVLSPSFRPR
ncbi:MAG: plasmid recombination protein [Deltaproteobacteria bacterium]|jgi:hypothetical protein|nr:plasmid recombination protein [Deltaproteobacteria bacterium]